MKKLILFITICFVPILLWGQKFGSGGKTTLPDSIVFSSELDAAIEGVEAQDLSGIRDTTSTLTGQTDTTIFEQRYSNDTALQNTALRGDIGDRYGTADTSAIIPYRIGEIYVDTDDNIIYQATGNSVSEDWVRISNEFIPIWFILLLFGSWRRLKKLYKEL